MTNASKIRRTFKVGTCLGSYEKANEVAEKVHTIIENDLLPHADQPGVGDRKGKIRELLGKQNWSHLAEEDRQNLFTLITQHHEVFILGKGELGKTQGPPVHFNLANPNPVRGPNYRYPEKAKAIIADLLKDMEERDVIEASTAAWLSPIVLVSKPDGSKRMYLDYRGVNKNLARDIYPLPRLEELVEMASGNKFYATLDLKDAYFQVVLDEKSRNITTFSDGVSLYRFKRLPFGLSCSPAIFSRQMAQLLSPLIRQGWTKNYLDDVIIFAPDFNTLLTWLDTLFQHLSKNGVKLNLSKCDIGKREVKFWGHIVSEAGCRPNPENVKAVQNLKPPTSVKGVRSFLGMCGFYRKHIPRFAKIAAPLTNLTRKSVEFQWTDLCQEAFDELKARLTQAPILVKADIHQPFIVTTDTSGTHVGRVLSQVQADGTNRPIGYFSRKLKGA